MAFSAVMTGTGVSTTLTNGTNTFTLGAADAGILVGATMQGTGIPTGSRVGTISGTTGTMVTATGTPSNFTGTTGATSVIYSSKFGSILTVSLSASGDYATPQNIYNAGFGVMSDNLAIREIYFAGGLFVRWSNIVSGAVFDFLNWSLEFGVNGRFAFQESTIVGELRGGYLVNGTQFIKTVGPTFYVNNFNGNSAGGTSIFENVSGTTNQGLFRMHNLRVVEIAGSNAAPSFVTARMTMDVENMILDYQGDSAGANAGVGAAFGTLKNTYLVKVNGGIGATNGTNFATWDGLIYTGNYGASPQHKFSTSQGYVLDGYSPQVLSTQFLGGFNSVTLEIYSNINLSTAGWGLDNLKTRYLRYFGPITLQFPRTVTFEFNDSTAANLTGVTLYIKSGTTSIVNAVQAGDYSANTQALNLIWNTNLAQYRTCDTFVDTINQVAQVRKYGYVQQSTSYSLNLAKYSQPFFMLNDTSLTGISEATASALTSINLDFNNKVATVTANATYDQLNARIAWALAQTTGSPYDDPRTITGANNVLASGWIVLVMPGVTLSAGTKITYMYADTFKALSLADTPYLFNSGGVLQAAGVLLTTTILGVQDTYTGTGSITAVYANSTGTSTTWQFQSVEVGTSLVIYDSSGVTKYFQQEVTSAGTYNYYIPPGVSATYYYAIEKYGTRRESGSFPANTGGLLFYVPSYAEDVGISQTTKATVAGYTAIENEDKFYDFTAYKRLSEQFIKVGQITSRDGTKLVIDAGYSVVVNQSAASVESLAGSTITIKSTSYGGGAKYSTTKLTPPATFTANSTEVITGNIEDGNGDSSVTIVGGDDLGYELWKVTTATPTANYATGTLLNDTIDKGQKYRFIGISGYDIVGVDINSNVRRRSSMAYGIYTQSFYVGEQIQLADDAPSLQALTSEIQILKVTVEAMPADFLAEPVETGATVAQSLRLANSVLGGKVSGAGTGTETFRDIADTKNRVISTVTPEGNRTAETYDLS